MTNLVLEKEAKKYIEIWRELIKEIDLTHENISGILKCLDFSYMYDAAKDLQIVNGYLFNEENKSDFLHEVAILLENTNFIEDQRQKLKELLNCTPAEYLEHLLAAVREKVIRKNGDFTQELEERFYKIMITVALVNIQAIKSFRGISN